MNKITLYNNYLSVTGKTVSIFKALESIKDGTYKMKIKNVRLFINDKPKRDIEKKKLPLLGFGGTFTTRSNIKLIKFSGYATLDFDHVLELKELINEVNKDKFTFSSFISPSGDGLKVLVKMPPVDNDIDYKSFYSEIQKHYNQYAQTDNSTKDISRATFVSYDPNLFYNVDSELFTDRFIPKIIEREKINIPLSDMDEVSKRLITWFNKKWTTGENRNNNLFVLSSAFNDYGVPKNTALDYCNNYISSDFKEVEIEKLVDSAYKNISNFGIKTFEDSTTVSKISRMSSAGSTLEQVINKVGDIKGVKEQFEASELVLDVETFWHTDDKDKVNISNLRFENFLKSKGISKHYPNENSADYEFLIKDDNFVDWIEPTRIKDMVKKNLMASGDYDIWDFMAKSPLFFKKEYLNMLDTVEIKPKRDTETESFLYYKNNAVKTTKQGSELIEYKDVKEVIWRNQIIDRNIILSKESDGEFKTFLWRLSGENRERYFTLKSVVGYLMHSYQNPSKPKAIIFNDEMISDDVPNGGSGKGLIHKAIGQIKNVTTENGKKFDPNGQFAYQLVNKDTQVFLLDDVSRNFNFENLFSIVTEGMIIEKKGQDAFKIPFLESPKISITTNYTVRGDSASFNRRVFEVEIANHYNDKNTPEDEFRHQFFSGWDDKEWAIFDNYMIRSVQFYLKNGLVESNKVNLEYRKFKQNTGIEFIEFMEGTVLNGLPIKRKELKDRFSREYPKEAKWVTAQSFNKKVKDYSNFNNFEIEEKKSNGAMCFYITNPNIENNKLNDLDY